MKRVFLFVLLSIMMTGVTFAQEVKYQLSSHILDISKGLPASGVTIKLSKMDASQQWKVIDEKVTDSNGRVKDFLKQQEGSGNDGIYKLTFLTEPYFKSQNLDSFYPFIEVIFEIKGNDHYHVPITLSPYGYSTYRGN